MPTSSMVRRARLLHLLSHAPPGLVPCTCCPTHLFMPIMKVVAALLLAGGGVHALTTTLRPTISPTFYPTRTPSSHPSVGPTHNPSMTPSKNPTKSSAPTPSPLWFPYEKCCGQMFNTQPKQCFQQTWSQCFSLLTQLIGRRQLADGSTDEANLAPVEVPEHLRRLDEAGSIPCTYFFTTLNQLTSYVKNDEGLHNGNMTRRIKGLFKGQGGIWCKAQYKYKGDCGCHSEGGYCAYKSRYNCENRMERISSLARTPKHMCFWMFSTPDPNGPDGTVPGIPAMTYPDDGYCLPIPIDPANLPPDPNTRPLIITWVPPG